MAWGLESEALPQHLRFTHLTQADGMVPGGIVAMLQDHQGYIWIATEEGLSRYDGYEVRNFRHDPASPSSLAENSLVALAFLPPRGTGSGFSQGMVWAATARGFLEQIDTLTGDIRHVSLTTNGKPIQLNRIKFLFADSQRRLWIGHRKGICRVNPDTLECREFDIGADDGGMAAWQASKPHSEGSPDAA
ncbi:MAG TPA: two-component regulator propeller domain-containing protein, partial [Verrucomicrobiales bacterium]|nr:two-component regulator propeller domain-containing protein [Verrucomicrobiales bacterium]